MRAPGRLTALAMLLLVAGCGATARHRNGRTAVGHHHAAQAEPKAGDPKCACASGKEGECGKEHHGYTGSKGFKYQWCYVAGGAASAKTCAHVLASKDHPGKGWKKCGDDLVKDKAYNPGEEGGATHMMQLMFKMMTTMAERGHEADKAGGKVDLDGLRGQQASMDTMLPQTAALGALARRAAGKTPALVQGTDRISSGYDVVTGQLKLPTLYFSTRQESLTDDPNTGKSIPAAIALVRESSAESSVARETFSDTKTLASRMAEDMGLESSFGYLTMSPAVNTLRRIQVRSDLTIARRVHKK